MNRKMKLVVIISLLGMVFACCVLSYLLIIKDCLFNCAPKRTFTTKELSIPGSYFPQGASVPEIIGDRSNTVSIDNAYADVDWDRGKAIYIVQRFASVSTAIEEYDRTVDDFSNDPVYKSEFLGIKNYQS